MLRKILFCFLLASCVNQTKESNSREKKDYTDNSTKKSSVSNSKIIEKEIKFDKYLFEGLWEYKNPHSTENINENHFIVINIDSVSKNIINGTYYGTSDDFDEAREGYLPGFFKAPIKILSFDNNSFVFEVSINDNDVSTRNLFKSNFKEKWGYGLRFNSRKYMCQLVENDLLISSQNIENRVFKKHIH